MTDQSIEEEAQRLNKCLQMREQQIEIMQDMMSELEQNLQENKTKYEDQKNNRIKKEKELQDCEKQLRDYRQDKELYFAKLQTEETLNDRLNSKINQFQNIIQSQNIKI